MDSETLLWLVLLAIYIFFQFVSGRKRPQAERTPAPSREPDGVEPRSEGRLQRQPSDEMDEALREIRQALGMEPPPPEPARPSEPRPAPPPPEPRTQPVKPPSPALPTRGGRREMPKGVRPEKRGRAESLTAGKAIPVDIYTQEPGGRRKETALQRSVRGHMKNRDALREAILLREILGPPRSKR